MSGNTVTIVGNLTRDPELKWTQSGTALVRFSVAHNHRWYNQTKGDFDEKVSYFDCVAWSALAENIAESLVRGNRVILLGRLDLQQWETDSGDKRSKVELVVESIGPDLQFATADVKKVEKGSRNSGGGGRGSQRDDEPPYSDDEEPF